MWTGHCFVIKGVIAEIADYLQALCTSFITASARYTGAVVGTRPSAQFTPLWWWGAYFKRKNICILRLMFGEQGCFNCFKKVENWFVCLVLEFVSWMGFCHNLKIMPMIVCGTMNCFHNYTLKSSLKISIFFYFKEKSNQQVIPKFTDDLNNMLY